MDKEKAKKEYREPKLEKGQKLSEVTEGAPLVITPGGDVLGRLL